MRWLDESGADLDLIATPPLEREKSKAKARHEAAKTWILAHLLMILLLEPPTCAPEISPRAAA